MEGHSLAQSFQKCQCQKRQKRLENFSRLKETNTMWQLNGCMVLEGETQPSRMFPWHRNSGYKLYIRYQDYSKVKFPERDNYTVVM